jgi:SHS2 domain-containing protein
MTYRIIDHTADLGIVVEADTLTELFRECLRAQTDCLTNADRVAATTSWSIRLEAAELSSLLVDFLEEMIFLYETEGLVFADSRLAVEQDETGWSVSGELVGEPYEQRRHGLKTLLKAVTYHQLALDQGVDGWRARVIFDI